MVSDNILRFDVSDDDTGRPVVLLFSRYASGHERILGIAIVASFLAPLIALVPIYLLQLTIDGVLLAEAPLWILEFGSFHSTLGQLVFMAGLMIGSVLLAACLAIISTIGWGRFAQQVQHQLRVDSFAAILHRGVPFVETQQTGQLMSILNDDIAECNRLLERFIKDLIETSTRFLGICTILVLLHWQLALLALTVVPMMVIISRWFIRRIRPLYAELRQRIGVLNARLENSLNGMAVVTSSGGGDFEYEKISHSSRQVYDAQWRVITAQAAFFPTMSALNWCGFAFIMAAGGYWYLTGPPFVFTLDLSLGVLIAFLLYNQQLATPLTQATHLLDIYYEARAAVRRILSLFEGDFRSAPASDVSSELATNGPLSFESVRFSYPGIADPVLPDFTLDIDAGSTVGIVGPTGSGKTTLLALVLKLYEPDDGTIYIDGQAFRELEASAIRSAIGYVPQEPYLFAGTLRDNITYPGRQVSEGEISRAIDTAQLSAFVNQLPDGIETPIGQDGVTLSGGQRQRVALARAILTDPPILLMDEATNNLDMATEVAIHRALMMDDQQRTTITVAHRLTSVQHADRIIVLEDGSIAESGTHDELIRDGGRYSTLWEAAYPEFNTSSHDQTSIN